MLSYKLCLFVVIAVTFVTADEDKYCELEKDFRIKEGTSEPHPTGCSKVTCEKAPGAISAVTCAAFQPAPGCHISDIDNSKRYPDCCPQPICD